MPVSVQRKLTWSWIPSLRAGSKPGRERAEEQRNRDGRGNIRIRKGTHRLAQASAIQRPVEFLGSHQVVVAPHGITRLIPELSQRVRLELPRALIVGVQPQHVGQDLRRPTEIAVRVRLRGDGNHRVASAHRRDVARGPLPAR